MDHLHYFTASTQEDYELAGTRCTTCGGDQPGQDGWWDIAGPTCTGCAILAEQVAEAAGERLVIGQILTLAQQATLAGWHGINHH